MSPRPLPSMDIPAERFPAWAGHLKFRLWTALTPAAPTRAAREFGAVCASPESWRPEGEAANANSACGLASRCPLRCSADLLRCTQCIADINARDRRHLRRTREIE